MAHFENGQYRLSTAMWPNHFVYMQDGFTGNVAAWNGDAGPSGWWQLINHPTMHGFYLLATKKWPECFAYMEGGLAGNIRGWNRQDPGAKGYFKFVPHRDSHGMEDGYYLLTNSYWEDKWFLYVESGVSGNVSSWSGDPGPQGWFKVQPWNIAVDGSESRIPKTLGHLTDSPGKASSPDSPSKAWNGRNVLVAPHMFEEVRLDVTHAEGTDLYRLSPTQRAIVFPVEKYSAFYQKVGRQYQQAFFEQVLPQYFGMLSRSVLEITLEPNAGYAVLKNVSRNVVQVGEYQLDAGGSMEARDGCLIGFGDPGQPPYLVLRLELRGSMTGSMDTCSSPGLMETMNRLPQVARDLFSSAPMERFPSAHESVTSDKRAPTVPCYSPSSSMLGGMFPGMHGTTGLECVYTSGAVDLSRIDAIIPLQMNEVVTIGRLHQAGFFEKLLPDHDALGCISRSHFTAFLHQDGQVVTIENLSRNTLCVDYRTLSQGEKADLTSESSLTFTTMGTTSLAFKLKTTASNFFGTMPQHGI